MSDTSQKQIETVTLYEELRLIEKDESEVSVVWRGVQLLLFFMAFVFGSFCTFCHHLLMYMFDNKCVLFPKLLSLRDMKKNKLHGDNKLIYDYMPHGVEALPVDFVSTRWVEKSVCYLPTYVPLWSGICGLIWTTMFLMCSSGSQTLTGLQRPWRILPTVFIFSLAMACVSIYTSVETQSGLNELCDKLGELTGTNTCSDTINVVTLAYDRRIRGVYPAIKLAIISAWLHSLCWLASAITVMLRIILVVDFRLVRVRVDLQGNIEKMLERHEKHIRTDEFLNKTSNTSVKVRFVNKGFGTESQKDDNEISRSNDDTVHFFSKFTPYSSEQSLVPDEMRKLTIRTTKSKVWKEHRFIVDLINDIVDSIEADKKTQKLDHVPMSKTESYTILRQPGKQKFMVSSSSGDSDVTLIGLREAEQLAKDFRRHLENEMTMENFELIRSSTLTMRPGSRSPKSSSTLKAAQKKSSLKNKSVQTVEGQKATPSRVKISSSRSSSSNSSQKSDYTKHKGEPTYGDKRTTAHRVQILSPSSSADEVDILKAPETFDEWARAIAESSPDLFKADHENLNKEEDTEVGKIFSHGVKPAHSEIQLQTLKEAPEGLEWRKSQNASTITIVPQNESEFKRISIGETKTPDGGKIPTPDKEGKTGSDYQARIVKFLSPIVNENIEDTVETKTPDGGETSMPDKEKKTSSDYQARIASLLSPFVNEDTEPIPSAQNYQQAENVYKKGILIQDDEVPGTSRSSEKENDPKENQGKSKKKSKKEKQE